MSRKSFWDLSGRSQRKHLRIAEENARSREEFDELNLMNEALDRSNASVDLNHHNENDSEHERSNGEQESQDEQSMEYLSDESRSRHSLGNSSHEHQEDDADVVSDQSFHTINESDEDLYKDVYEDVYQDVYEDSSEDEEGLRNQNAQQNNLQEDTPVYSRCPLNVGQSMLVILTIFIVHNVTQTCLATVIDAINMHCINEDLQKNSLYKFKKYFHLEEVSEYKKHYYCSECSHELENPDEVCPQCKEKKGVSYFLELPFLDQLKDMYKRDGFQESLQHRFHRRVHPGHIEDVYDSMLYQKLVNEGFFSKADNISLSWYTDGIPVFKSSNVGMWPLYLSINELPFESRCKRENILLAGIWFGTKKPVANSFLRKFDAQFSQLAAGINVDIPGRNTTVQGLLLFGTCDLPAKSEFLNLIQYNGAFGCPKCESPGETFRLGPRSHTHVYRYTEHLSDRTVEDTERHGEEALLQGAPVMGVKGPCTLSTYMPDFIDGIGIDRMHGIDGGVIKKLLTLWFTPKFRSRAFSLIVFKDLISQRLQLIKPPSFIHRFPRSIDDLLHWKASELKNWAFYYSVPILSEFMKPDYFQHYLLLITSISMLSAESITPGMIVIVNQMIHLFVRQFQTMYGLEFCSINLHQLLHLPKCVELIGPLWAYTCYPFEDLNGQFVRTVHGTWHIDTQVAASQILYIRMKGKLDSLTPGAVRDFCVNRKKQVKIQEPVYQSCYSVGAYSKFLLNEEIPDLIHEAMNQSQIQPGRIQIYKRLLKQGKLFISSSYSRSVKNDSSHISFIEQNEEHFGKIHCFIKLTPDCECIQACTCQPEHYAIVGKLECQRIFGVKINENSVVRLMHLYECNEVNDIIAVPVSRLHYVCIYMPIDNKTFIASPINSKELE